MAARSNNARNFPGFSFGLNGSRAVVSKSRNAYNTNDFRKFCVTVTFEGSHIQGLILTIANASKKEVK